MISHTPKQKINQAELINWTCKKGQQIIKHKWNSHIFTYTIKKKLIIDIKCKNETLHAIIKSIQSQLNNRLKIPKTTNEYT